MVKQLLCITIWNFNYEWFVNHQSGWNLWSLEFLKLYNVTFNYQWLINVMAAIDILHILIGYMGILKFIYYKNLGIHPKVNQFIIIHERNSW